MNLKIMQPDNINSSLIKVESLQKEFDVTLQQYHEASQSYIESMNTDTLSGNDVPFVRIEEAGWWGTGGIAEKSVSSVDECKNMCLNSENCSGATFNEVKKYCWTRTGDSILSHAMGTDALIPKKKAILIWMKVLNEKLLDINNKIINENKNMIPEVNHQHENKNKKQKELNNAYNVLLEQKIEMEKKLQEYYSIEASKEDKTLYVTKKSNSMRIWTIFTIIMLFMTCKQLYGSEIPSVSKIIWIFIILTLIGLTYIISNPSGFALWLMLLVVIMLMQTGYLPSI